MVRLAGFEPAHPVPEFQYLKSRMEAANSYLQALQGQHEVMKHQAEIPEKINDKKQAEASAKAETEAVKKIVNEKSFG